MFRTLNQAFIASAFVIAAATGVMIAIVHEKWVFVPVVVLGVVVAQLAILWKWQMRPYAGEIHRVINDNSLIVKVVLLLGSPFVQAVAIASMWITYFQVHERISVCLSTRCGREYVDLVIIAGAGGLLEIVGSFISILAILGIVRRTRHDLNQ